jgi:hypothetical protein
MLNRTPVLLSPGSYFYGKMKKSVHIRAINAIYLLKYIEIFKEFPVINEIIFS